MFSSSKEELDELLRHLSIWQPRNFEKRRLLDMENLREFRVNFRLFEGRFRSSFEFNKPAIRVDISIG